MSEKHEALRLADMLMTLFPSREDGERAAAELRRLHAKCEALTADTIEEMRRINEIHWLTAQRDALLEALRKIAAIGNKMWGPDWEEIDEAREIARAAIAKTEGEKK